MGLPLGLFFSRGKSYQTSPAIENWYIWAKLNWCQKVDISRLKMASPIHISNWPILTKFWTIRRVISIFGTQWYLKRFSSALMIQISVKAKRMICICYVRSLHTITISINEVNQVPYSWQRSLFLNSMAQVVGLCGLSFEKPYLMTGLLWSPVLNPVINQ